jgi:hypothetical protein
MQRLEVSGAVRKLYWSLGVKGLTISATQATLNVVLTRDTCRQQYMLYCYLPVNTLFSDICMLLVHYGFIKRFFTEIHRGPLIIS